MGICHLLLSILGFLRPQLLCGSWGSKLQHQGYSDLKKEILTHTTDWTNLKNTMLSEISHIDKEHTHWHKRTRLAEYRDNADVKRNREENMGIFSDGYRVAIWENKTCLGRDRAQSKVNVFVAPNHACKRVYWLSQESPHLTSIRVIIRTHNCGQTGEFM